MAVLRLLTDASWLELTGVLSLLMQAFQGDNMVASAVAVAAFGSQAFPLVLSNIKSTNSGSVKTGM